MPVDGSGFRITELPIFVIEYIFRKLRFANTDTFMEMVQKTICMSHHGQYGHAPGDS